MDTINRHSPAFSQMEESERGWGLFIWGIVMRTLSLISAALVALPSMLLAFPIPDTGQTKCYDSTQEIICPNFGELFYGQDAQYGPNLQSYTKLDENGNDLPDDTTEWLMVRDNVTGLIWGMPIGYANWYEVQDGYIADLNEAQYGGRSDWRLPTVKELCTITDKGRSSPAINTLYFPNVLSAFWSSTNDGGYAFQVNFITGETNPNGHMFKDSQPARAVQGGQCDFSGNYIDNGDGTVTDAFTGLMWQQNSSSFYGTWQEALDYCESLTLANHNDWRLPNINELHSLVDYSREANPLIDVMFFPDTIGGYRRIYWSSTTSDFSQNEAWYVNLYGGAVSYLNKLYYSYGGYYLYMRAVRGVLCSPFGDTDSDCFIDCMDNCVGTNNPEQQDSYPPQGNGIGDACDCEGNFNSSEDQDVDGSDAALFKADFGRSVITEPCTGESPCNGDFNCDGDADGTDASLFKADFGRSSMQNPCPMCVVGQWCSYQLPSQKEGT